MELGGVAPSVVPASGTDVKSEPVNTQVSTGESFPLQLLSLGVLSLPPVPQFKRLLTINAAVIQCLLCSLLYTIKLLCYILVNVTSMF